MSSDAIPYSHKEITHFITALGELTDPRDNRGKRHNLVFVIVSVILAIFTGRSTMSSIHRYIVNKIDWLREMTEITEAQQISRAQLPRILERSDWYEINEIAEKHFGIHIELNQNKEWVALDGKTLRGTIGYGNKQAILLAVTHETRRILAQAKMSGPKSSEIPAVRQLLKHSGLEKQKISLDAHHCNPKTTAQINQAGGLYLTQVKDNQPKLKEQCEILAETSPLGNDTTVEKAHGRITTRHAKIFSMKSEQLAKRWKNSSINTLIVMERNTYNVSKKKRLKKLLITLQINPWN